MTDERFQLPDFEGEPVVALAFWLSGSIRCVEDQPPIILRNADRHVMLVEVDVQPPGFKRTDEGLVRVQNARLLRAFIVPPEQAARLMAERVAEVDRMLSTVTAL